MLFDSAALILGNSFRRILGKPEPGSMAFTRCLPPNVLNALVGHERFGVEGWRVAAVVDVSDSQSRSITADEAVELREGKGAATLLLVDPSRAGAGMDGIYGATREIGETELLRSPWISPVSLCRMGTKVSPARHCPGRGGAHAGALWHPGRLLPTCAVPSRIR